MATIGKGILAPLVLGVIAAAGAAHAQGPKDATDATKAANAAVLQSLPFSDRQSFEDAPAPETVNPSLRRQAQLLKISSLFQVTEEI